MGALGILSAIGGFGKSLFAKIPWQAWAAIAAAVAILVGIHMHSEAIKRVRSTAYASGASDTKTAFLAAQAKADAAALKQKQDMEAHYAALASQKDREYETELASARDATDRYIATHSVRVPSNQGGTGATVAAPTNHGPGVPQGLPAATVMVSPDDVQACSDAVSYATAAHDWALGLERKP